MFPTTEEPYPQAAPERRVHLPDHRYGGTLCHAQTREPVVYADLIERVTCLRCAEIHQARTQKRDVPVEPRMHLADRLGAACCRHPGARRLSRVITQVTCRTCRRGAAP